jgi:hypothetical protein
MADIQVQLEQAKTELERATENLAKWVSFGAVTVTNEKGKENSSDAQPGAGLRFATGHVSSINSKRVPQFILCPSCGRHMRTFANPRFMSARNTECLSVSPRCAR